MPAGTRHPLVTLRTTTFVRSSRAPSRPVAGSSSGLPRPGLASASCHRTRRRFRCCPYSAGRHPRGGSSARRAGGPVGGQFLSRGRTTSHTISPTRTSNSTPIPSHPSEPIPFPKPPIMVNSSFVCPVSPGHLQCLAWVLPSRPGTIVLGRCNRVNFRDDDGA